MKGRIIGIMVIGLGLLLILVPWSIFPVCGMGRYSSVADQVIGLHGCHATFRAEIVLGIIAIITGMVPVLWPVGKSLLGASIMSLVISILVILFPSSITGVCTVPTMACRLGTFPALVTLGILMAITSGAGILLSRKQP